MLLGAAGYRALTAQLVPLGPEEEMYTDIYSNVILRSLL
jgi:hypothetical protein